MDLEAVVLLVSFTHSVSYILSASSLGFSELWDEGFDGGILFRAVCFKSTQHAGCESLCLFPSAAGGSFSDDN